MHKIFLISVLFIGFSTYANNNAVIDTANSLYTQGRFEQAIDAYNSIIKTGLVAPELYYNLGNAYFKSNNFAMAILNYERALKLNYDDPDIIFNLNLANTYVIDKIEPMPEFFMLTWQKNIRALFSPNNWTIISMATFGIAIVLLLMFFLSQKTAMRKISFWLGIFILLISVITFNIARKTKWSQQNEPYAIIITPAVVATSSPSDSGTELFLIHEGLKVQVIDKVGNYKAIKLINGNVGWVKGSDLIEI